jgi:hypothetical protein
MNDDRKIDHAMMSFALMGHLLVTPRPPKDRPKHQISLVPKRSWFLKD